MTVSTIGLFTGLTPALCSDARLAGPAKWQGLPVSSVRGGKIFWFSLSLGSH